MAETILIQKAFKNDMEFDRFRWVLSARSTDPMRKAIMGMYISPDHWAVCTDGHRLHMYKIERMTAATPGIYFVADGGMNKKIITLQRDEDNLYEFPDYPRVIPEGTPMKWITFPTGDDKSAFKYLASQVGLFNDAYIDDAFLPSTIITMHGWGKGSSNLIETLEYRTELDPDTKKEIKRLSTRCIVMGMLKDFYWEYPPEPVVEAPETPAQEATAPELEGTEGQDRESYNDDQDRETYVPAPGGDVVIPIGM